MMYPEVRAAVAADDSPDLSVPGFDVAAHREKVRRFNLRQPREDVASVEDVDADGVPCRLYTPADARPGLVVHAHGGGFVLNDVDVHDGICRRMANRGRRAVLSVDYRRPPEARFPAAPDDLDTVVRWLRREGPPGPYAAHGDSAGANLALVVALRNPGFFTVLALIYPFLDPRCAFPSWDEARDTGFDPAEAQWYWEQYGGPPDDPDLAPLRSRRRRFSRILEPVLVIAAEHDPLLEENHRLVQRLRSVGVDVQVTTYPGMVHGFWRNPALFDAAEESLAEIADFLRRAV